MQSRWNSLEEEATSSVGEFLSYDRVMEVNPFEITDRHERQRPGFERRRAKAIDELGLGTLLDRRLLTLSNGERQRVQLARAFCQPLRLLILDEPFIGLDSASRKRLHEILNRWMATPLRLLIVTTRPEDLPSGITNILRVEKCRVVGQDTWPNRALRKPARATGQAAVRRRIGRPARAGSGSELVRLRRITIRYGGRVILRDLDWTVTAGENWALLGPNGSGKTTLLSLITGDNPQAYAQEVTVFGRRHGEGIPLQEIKKRIGYVSPELHLHYDGSVPCFDVVASGFGDTVGLFEKVTGKRRLAVEKWLARFGLRRWARTPLGGLSAGLQRMTLLARALVKEPELLILDEPCQGLDREHRRLFVDRVDRLIRNGAVTAIYVTHRPDEIPPSIGKVFRLPAERTARRAGFRRSGR